MAIFFIADTHFGHANIIRFCGRPFENKYEHDETIINNWNSIVSPSDTVYHLGDFGFGSPEWLTNKVCNKLKGKICLIKGNHDKNIFKEPIVKRFEIIKDVHFLCSQYKGKKYEIFLSHYPHRSWPKSYHGSIHMFGHVHGRLPPWGLSFDVGVDCWNFSPVSLDQVMTKVEELKSAWDREKVR